MISQKYVDEYIDLWETGKIILNQERIDLIRYLQKHVLTRTDVYFDEETIENCIKFVEKWYFPTEAFQRFIIAFVFLIDKEIEQAYFTEIAIFMGRGGGKNGLISAISDFLSTPLHGVEDYHISIVANSEDQAKTSFDEIYKTITKSKRNKTGKTPNGPYIVSKTEIKNRETGSIIKYNTSNTKTKDGGREGCVIFDEIHYFEGPGMVNVKRGGLGKKDNRRTFYISTDGHLREGYMDSMKDKIKSILSGEFKNSRMFPFYCKLDDPKEIDDEAMWEKANPMFHRPLSKYAKTLLSTVREEYDDLPFNRSNRPEFVTKRMNLPEQDPESIVAPWEEVLATNRPMPDLKDKECIGGLDYAFLKDFASVGLLFREGEDYIWKTHSFIRKGFLDSTNLEPPIHEWEKDGLLTIVDTDVIEIKFITDWFLEMSEQHNLTKVIADNYRTDIVRHAFEEIGIELEVLRNPKSLHGLLAPRIDTMFAKKLIVFGDNPLMRWFTNNVAVKMMPDGSKQYIKKDEIYRKTDGFHAMLHALYRADDLLEADIGDSLDFLNAINF
ncbi:terminase TerL endonuclease subunit [Staphylococcus saprophyticus]|uniref:terminase TerL endonuclease subunit n=1 Tax=Staphylococcus saprophyticus TaxID=29385 RepID=UPI0006618A11|nr:terminase TerL endonuclease subunit [Staphylococcus saprophyticus]AMG33626.1 terminase large subunit [Staphylococcus saprophyticus]MDW3837895.1 terminase large subunit [Staphylococcus saprophyticus]MDW4061921.1 terminase large subunit [Staphylococcus saprophyticus]MDW4104012.1 terminase large subunit [Staphylococcus saprophyticus]MDW4205098.1 terminase large subunit [Staphylococcus saprophyticus]